MTLEDVRQAQGELQALGVPVSASTVLARIGGSKRDVLRHLRTLRGGLSQPAPPVPSPEVVPTPNAIASIPRASEAVPRSELASFRARYQRTSAAALGTAAGSSEQQDLERLLHEFAQR